MSDKRDAFEALYQSKNGAGSWYDGISPEAQQWLTDLAAYVDKRGDEPIWTRALARFTELFPNEAPRTAGTISATVRRLRG